MTSDEEAVTACRDALKKRSRDHDPSAWAQAQYDLGEALARASEGHEDGDAYLMEAVEAYRAALQIWTVERQRYKWVMAENNLAKALTRLGEYESGTARFEEALARCDTVLLHVLVDDAWDDYVSECKTIRERALRLLAMRPSDLEADFYLYPSEQSGRRGALGTGFQALCLSKDDGKLVFRCLLDIGPKPMRPGERRHVRFKFEQGAAAAESLRKAGKFYLRELGILGEATVSAA
jgi:tetratricopeptide (TPR) repeat protein